MMASNSSKEESSKMLNPRLKESNVMHGVDIPKSTSNSSSSSKAGSGSNYTPNIYQQIFQHRRNSVDVDVLLLARRSTDDVTADVLVPCHKIFLRTCPYFSAQLDAAPPNEPGEISKIDIDLDHKILEEMLRYIYTGEIQINAENWVQLFGASIKLQLNDKELMVKFTKFQIETPINENNWLEMLRVFNSAGAGDSCGKFLREIFGYLREKSSELMNWPSFLQLTFDEVRLILNPESRVYKNVRDFQASLLKWINHDAISKSHLISELSACSFVELPEIIDLSESEPSEDQRTDDNYNCTTESDSEIEIEDLDVPLATRALLNYGLPQVKSPALSLLFCTDNHFYIYSVQEKKCRQLASLPIHDLHGFSMILANDRLFMKGGHKRNTTSFSMSKKVYSCTIAELSRTNQKVSWKKEHKFCELANFSTLCVNGDIYTIGGLINIRENGVFHKPIRLSYVLSSGEEGNKQNEGWKTAFCYNLARSQCAVAQLNDTLYIIGGIGINRDLRLRDKLWERGPDRVKLGVELIAIESVEVFNTKDKLLCSVADLRLARFDHQAVILQDKIIVIGGKVIKYGSTFEKVTSVEVYDPTTNSWRNGPSLNVPRANFAAFVIDEKIFVLGGNLGKPTMEVYNPRKNKWSLEPCGDFPAKTNFSQFVIIK